MKWKRILAREYGVQYTEISLRCLTPVNEFIVPRPFYEQVYVPEDGNQVCYIDEDKWNSFIRALKEKYLDNPENYDEFEKLLLENGENYLKMTMQIAGSDLKNKSNNELKRVYLDYQNKSLRYAPFIWIQFIVNNFFADKVKEIIEIKLDSDKNVLDLMEIALKPDKKAAVILLNEIAFKWETLDETEKFEIYKKFQWLPCLDIHNKPWTKEEFFSHIMDFKKIENNSSISYESLIENIKPSDYERRVLEAVKRLAYIKDQKDDFRRQGVFYGQPLFKEIADRMGLELKDMSYLLEVEIVDFLENENIISREVIENRKKGFVIYFTPENKIACKTGNDIKLTLDEIGLSADETLSEEIKGTSASIGKAVGIVKIIRGVSDLNKIQKGDILVAVTTHPDYVVAMHKVSAILTDEGGMTSHAAIVSRELGIPCIVGTRNATKILKDGDRVEIDAGKGIVRKIK